MPVTIVAAADLKRVIGKDNRLPWHLPADLKRFRALTTGKAVVMGRSTYLSIGRPLPQRTNIVLSRDPTFRAEGCETSTSLAAALALGAHTHAEVMIIGGAQVYGEALPMADRLVLTVIHACFEGDAWFPAVPSHEWVVCAETDVSDLKYSAKTYDLRRSSTVPTDPGGPAWAGPGFVWPRDESGRGSI